jgi:pyrroloquinoline quinone biosynthesis protein E
VNWAHVVPRFRRGVRITYDHVRGQDALLHPEGVALLNETAGATLSLVDHETPVAGIVRALDDRFQGVRTDDVTDLLRRMEAARLVELLPARDAPIPPVAEQEPAGRAQVRRDRDTPLFPSRTSQHASYGLPLGLLAELTHRCPLHCAYCSNPLDLSAPAAELPTSTWLDVIAQARELGVLQVHLSGGEPLLRRDLETLAAGGRSQGMYVNLVTSGIGLSVDRAQALAAAGVDHVQLSFQGAQPATADRVAGAKAHNRKLAAAAAIRAAGMALTINVVLHRGNVTEIAALADLAARLDADRLELAHAQYYGWALRNRASLLPTARQVQEADAAALAARNRHSQLEIIYVACDYYEETPKPCMNGWASRQLTITPGGTALPCPAGTVIRDLNPPRVSDASLAHIWFESPAFTRFRGTTWLPEPCRSCPVREADFGGCRCQAYQLLGDAGATDPVCMYSPQRGVVDAAVATAVCGPSPPIVYRAFPPARPEHPARFLGD